MMKPTAVPDLPHPKHLYIPFDGDTTKDGVFSLWNGQHAIWLAPRFFKVTKSPTTSTICAVSRILFTVSCGIILLFVYLFISVVVVNIYRLPHLP